MLPRIRELTPLPELRLRIRFDDDRCVIYNVADDLSLPGYVLYTVTHRSAQTQSHKAAGVSGSGARGAA